MGFFTRLKTRREAKKDYKQYQNTLAKTKLEQARASRLERQQKATETFRAARERSVAAEKVITGKPGGNNQSRFKSFIKESGKVASVVKREAGFFNTALETVGRIDSKPLTAPKATFSQKGRVKKKNEALYKPVKSSPTVKTAPKGQIGIFEQEMFDTVKDKRKGGVYLNGEREWRTI